MVSPSLRQVMLAAEGAGELLGPDISRGEAEHPVCGDHLQLDCRLEGDGDRLLALAWRAQGCVATLAVAAAAPGALLGQPVARAASLLRQRLQSLGDLHATERHAEKLFLEALEKALASRFTGERP